MSRTKHFHGGRIEPAPTGAVVADEKSYYGAGSMGAAVLRAVKAGEPVAAVAGHFPHLVTPGTTPTLDE